MDEMQTFYDAAFPRLERSSPTSTHCRSTPCPTTPAICSGCATRWCNVSFPVEVWRQPRVPDSGAASMDAVVEPAV